MVRLGPLADAGEAPHARLCGVDELHLDRRPECGQLGIAQRRQIVDGELERAARLVLGRRVPGGLVVQQDHAALGRVDAVDAPADEVAGDLHLEGDLEAQRLPGLLGLPKAI